MIRFVGAGFARPVAVRFAICASPLKWLYSKLKKDCENLDQHKYSALLLVVLIKNPLFKSKAKNSEVGYCEASFLFAWMSALHMLICFIDNGRNASYVNYIKSRNISIPSEKYVIETLRSFRISFRPFKEEKSPPNSRHSLLWLMMAWIARMRLGGLPFRINYSEIFAISNKRSNNFSRNCLGLLLSSCAWHNEKI